VDDEDEDEESWTFVGGDEPDPDFVTKKLSESFGGLGPAGLSNRGPALGSMAIKGGASGPPVTGI
jgi:sterol 3beta-glucosyltransferase